VRRVTVELPEDAAVVLDALGFLDGHRPGTVARELLCAELEALAADPAVQALVRAKRRHHARSRLHVVEAFRENDADARG
jgi:hypothetical protein